MKRIFSIYFLVALLVSCSTHTTDVPTSTPRPTETQTPSPSVTPIDVLPTTPVATLPPVMLFEQSFETDSPGGIDEFPGFHMSVDDAGNHFICNEDSPNYTNAYFGTDSWADYAVEIRVKTLAYREGPYVTLHARLNASGQVGYYGSLNFQTGTQDLAYNDPYENLGHQYVPTTINNWYLLRLEVLGNQISYYINDQLIATGVATQRSQGKAGFLATPHMQVCIDDIRVWALTGTGLVEQAPSSNRIWLEVVTDNADPGNAWGGHQTRIVRTNNGVFTVFMTSGSGAFSREWHLAWRRGDNDWPIIAEGNAGDSPVNLLASPDGTLHIIGWPEGVGTIWSGKPNLDKIQLVQATIPGVVSGFWSYHSAGIDTNGDICVFTSRGGEAPGGSFRWACYQASDNKWFSHTTTLDYRYCYTYVFPQPNGQLSLVSTRDVRWSALGYTQPENAFDYVFNAIGLWQTDNIAKNLLTRTYTVEERPTAQFPSVYLNAQQDAYLDTYGQMHILYWIQGASTSGTLISHHLVLSPTGEVLHDIQLPQDEGQEYARIFQDAKGEFYILSSSGLLYPAGQDSLTLGQPIQLDLEGYTVEYSGFAVSVPRTGTAISNIMDVAFPSGGGKKWIYFQLNLPNN